MTARIIWIFKNNEQSAVAPRSALSAGAAHAARPLLLDAGRAAHALSPPARLPLPARGNLALSRFGKRAPLFDATAERWIVPPSTVMVDAVAPAEQEDCSMSVTPRSLTLPSPAAVPPAAGRWEAVTDVLTTALGLTVFGLIAGFFLVLS